MPRNKQECLGTSRNGQEQEGQLETGRTVRNRKESQKQEGMATNSVGGNGYEQVGMGRKREQYRKESESV